jgi:hypothetical protein
MLSSFVACAAVIPDYNARSMDKSDKKPRVEVVISPWGPRLCDQKVIGATNGHHRRIHVVLSQHNKELEESFIMVNKKKGYRYVPMQSASLTLFAGVGRHHIEYGTFVTEEDGTLKATWTGERKMIVRCCHKNQSDEILRVSK